MQLPDLDLVADTDLWRMSQASTALLELINDAYEMGRPIITELIGDTPISQWEHYPADDLFDPKARVLIFYHAHCPEDRQSVEHGHFHCFVECSDVDPDLRPLAKPRKRTGRRLCHIAGISVDMRGVPTSLFAPNQWVAGGWLYPASVASELVRRYSLVDKDAPRVFQWIARLITLFEPEIGVMLRERDRQLGAGVGARRRARDRALEILAEVQIDIDAQIDAVATETRRRRRQA